MQGACIILPSMNCPALQNSSTFIINSAIFLRIVTENKTCDLLFSSSFVFKSFHSKKN
jgi:hypothetical protein